MAMSGIFGNQSKSYLSELVRQGLNSFIAFGYEKITVGSSVVTLTPPAGAKYATITVESSVTTGVVIRCLQNLSTTVTSSVGQGLRDGSVLDITMAENLKNFQAIQAQAGTHNIYVEYFK